MTGVTYDFIAQGTFCNVWRNFDFSQLEGDASERHCCLTAFGLIQQTTVFEQVL
jgi:hypothetical protein